MKIVLISILCPALLLGLGEAKKAKTEGKYELVWQDEFSYNGLPDSTKWSYDTGGHGWGNGELQYYTAARKENARVENGMLVIEARKESTGGMNYSSARLVSKGKRDPKAIGWQYGKIEVKAKIPSGRGTWPAIWMLGTNTPLEWPDDGEIDIMEHVGFNQGTVHASIHCKKYYHHIGTQKTATVQVPDCSEQFHVYAVEWNRDSVKIAVDGKVYFRFWNEQNGYETWPFDNKMYLIMNIAVGGGWGGQQGVDDTIFPKRMEIDFVRVYQVK